jgi:DNA-binding LacI/PurR family transcriptional regulator
VSVLTVRAAQEKLTREGLLEIRHGSGVYVAGRPVQSRCVGIYTALDILQPRTSSFNTLMPRALRRFLRQNGFEAGIYIGDLQAGEREDSPSDLRFVADVAAGRLDGVALLNAPNSTGWAEWVARLQIPAVGAHTPYGVEVSYDAMVREGVKRLHAQGCRRIAMLSWYWALDGLRQPLRDALASLHLAYHPEWVRRDLHPMLSGAGWEEFREMWTARREKPDGLLVADDMLFSEVQIAVQELGIRVPDQLRIVTHANKGADRRYSFPVTLAQFDPERYAELLGEMLLKRLRGEAVVRPRVQVPPEFVKADPGAAPVKRAVEPYAMGAKERMVLVSGEGGDFS